METFLIDFQTLCFKVKIPLFGGFVDASFYVSSKIKWVRKKGCPKLQQFQSDNWSLKRKTQTFRRNVVVHEFFVGRGYFFRADFPLEFSTKTLLFWSCIKLNLGANLHFFASLYSTNNYSGYNSRLCRKYSRQKKNMFFSQKELNFNYFVTLIERSERYLHFKGNCNFEFSRQNQQKILQMTFWAKIE